MRILLIANRFNKIFKIDSGGALRNNLFVRALSEIGHVDVICFSHNGLVSNIPNCDVIFSKMMYKDEGYMEAARSLVCMTLWPLKPNSYYQVDKEKADIVKSFVEETEYDIIACRYIDTAIICGLLRYKDRLVIDADDNPVSVLKSLAILASSKLERWKKQYESKRIGRMVENMLNGIRCSFCSNPLELPSPHTIYLHNTTVLRQFPVDIVETNSSRILFVGWMGYPPNKQGITHFVESVFPHIKRVVPNAELHIVGSGEPAFLTYLNGKDGVRAIGRVDDIVPEYQEASVVVIPIYYGSGTSVKFIEALFMNRPVVSSPMGARGFSEVCKDGQDYMLANTDEEFANKTIELLRSETKSKEIAKNGYLMAKKHFSQEMFVEIVKNAIIGS